MSKGFRQSQSFLHTWSGLLLGWVLFIVFVAGTIAFWREGLNRYMRPELPRVEQPMRVLAGAQRFLQGKAPGAKSWSIAMPWARMPGATVFWQPQPKPGETRGRGRGGRGRRDTQALIAADGLPATVRDTRGGEFFYRFHFDLHYMPVIFARWIVGIATMLMLVAILSGIVTHKKIFRDFFTLRRGKGQRSWLDGHNATGVLALPFHLMITYTGLVTLMAMLMPWAVVANYTDRDAVNDALFPHAAEVERSGRPAPLVDLAALVPDAERRLGGPVGFIEVRQPGDAMARVTMTRASSSMLSSHAPRVTFDGVTGTALWRSPAPGGAALTAGAMVGLHAGRFADTTMRWLYFLCGIGGTLMVASGLVLWTVKRREKLPDPARPPLGFRLVERLNIAVVGGFPLGIAAMLWANRLLPVGGRGRAETEVHMLFLAWGAAALLSLGLQPGWAWAALLGATGAVLALLPLYNAVAGQRGIPVAMAQGDMLFVGVDLTLLAFGLALLAVAARVLRHRPSARRARARRAAPAGVMTDEAVPEPAE
ncbi:PepSY-associated TM helix domain-containing protein [Sphingomonas solaris]|uniref:PepSY domain-containing protein n=1 Tax=Alterirhizorhabdus solaris TaxID=2529389 RepID=A0A558R0K3_9SPHN|nr:PepSY-associated TM helix domain-containing protein [Sphingomonas solaris]TVV72925.1 PepSY domain-containing protein [Sphingomonas solaris]